MPSITYLQTILRCFAAMEIDGLRLYLKEEYTYQEASKEVFLDKIEAIFERHRSAGDTELLLYPGACAGTDCENCGKKGYRFVGNRSNNYLDLLFETKGDDITDIYSCSQFRSDIEIADLNDRSSIDIDLDETANFPKPTSYWTRVYAAQDAYNEMITQPPRRLRFDEIEFWLTKHDELYKRLGGFRLLSRPLKWSSFLFIYYEFKEIAEVISPNLDKIRQANREYKEKWTEQELIDWVISYEEIFHLGTLELKYFLVKIDEYYGFAEFDQYFFTGEVFAEVYAFFHTIEQHFYPLLEKYTIFTGDEEEEIADADDWKNESDERDLLRFHIQKRKEMEALDVFLPFYLGGKKGAEEEIPF